jgi:hypothetical protein
LNKLTRKIRNKGYTLLEFCKLMDICLRTYRTHEHKEGENHDKIVKFINELESK